MSTVTITRRIDLGRLPFPCTARETAGTVVITAEVSQATLDSAVASAPTDTSTANAATVRSNAASALDANRSFLAIASPSTAQNAAQIKALTRQMNGLIRLTLGQLDGTD